MIAGFGNLNCFPQSREASATCVLCYFLGTDAASCAVSDPLHQRLRLRRRVHQRPGAERELQHSGHQVNITNGYSHRVAPHSGDILWS